MSSVVCRRCGWQRSAAWLCIFVVTVILGCTPPTPEPEKTPAKSTAEKATPTAPAAKPAVDSAKPAAESPKPMTERQASPADCQAFGGRALNQRQ